MSTVFKSIVDWPNGVSTLNANITSGATTIVLASDPGSTMSTSNFYIRIGFEQILVASRTTATLTCTGGRGANGTTAAAHFAGDTVAQDFFTADVTAMRTAINTLEDQTQKLNSSGNMSGATINNSTIGASVPSTGAFTTLSATGPLSTQSRYLSNGYYNGTYRNTFDASAEGFVAHQVSSSVGAVTYSFDPTTAANGNAIFRLFRFASLNGTGNGQFIICNPGTATTTFSVSASSGDTVSAGILTAQGGTVTAGVAATTRGILAARSGSGGAAPGCTLLVSKNGTAYYFWVTDAGVLRRHTSLPAADTDGTAV